MPLFLAVAQMLHNADRRTWLEHPLSRDWWPNAVTILEVSPPIQANDIIMHLELLPNSSIHIRFDDYYFFAVNDMLFQVTHSHCAEWGDELRCVRAFSHYLTKHCK